MEGQFKAVPEKGKLVFKNQIDHDRYMVEMDGIELDITMNPAAKTGEKMRMYHFLYGPLAEAAMRGYTRQGWEGMDKVIAVYKLRAEFAKDFIYNTITKQHEPYLIELKKMDKARLLKFIQDCIFHIETNLETEAPDSQSWKSYQLTGRKFNFKEKK